MKYPHIITSKEYLYISVQRFIRVNDKDFLKISKQIAFEESCKKYREFYYTFLAQFTTYTSEKIYQDYMDFSDVSKEIILEQTGILIANAGNNLAIYCIPKTRQDIFDWIISNCIVYHKVLKKTIGSYTNRGPSTFYRDHYDRLKFMSSRGK